MTDATIPRFHVCIECQKTKLIAEFGVQTRNKQPFNQCKCCKAAIRAGTHLPRLKQSNGLCPLTNKQCSTCKEIKSPTEFYWRKQRGYAEARCITCRQAKNKAYSATDKARASRRVAAAKSKGHPLWKERQQAYQARHRATERYRATQNTPEGRQRRERQSRNNHLRSNFGMTIEEFEAMEEAQDGLCAICHKPPIHRRRLSVDHDHETGAIRGLLCQRCNYALGHFQDSPQIIESALAYIKKHSQLKLAV